jgi:hypothetical protein
LIAVKTPWIPIFENNGHECLLAKVDSFADRTGPSFDANIDRHVGQRNLFLAAQQDDLTSLIDSLGQTLPEETDVLMLYGTGDVRTRVIEHSSLQIRFLLEKQLCRHFVSKT